MKITPRRQRTAPTNRPGKKPATTAVPGKRLQCGITGWLESIPEAVGLVAVVEEGESDGAEVVTVDAEDEAELV